MTKEEGREVGAGAMAEGSSASSRLSASTGHGRGGGFRDSGPPIPYRNAPLDYYPPVMCCCNLKSLKLISWSDDNSGRRYHRCKHVWVRFLFSSESILRCISSDEIELML